MFRLWKVAYGSSGFVRCYDAPDAAGSGSGADPVSDGGAGATPAGEGDGSDPDARASAAGADDDEDDDDLDLDEDQPITPERFKKVTAKLKKLSRRDRRFQPIRQRLKELADSEGVTLDDLVLSRRQLAQLERQIQANPRMRALFEGDARDDPAPERRPPAKKADEPEPFDEKTLPFDPNLNEANRYFADLAKRNHELTQTVRQLQGRVETLDGRDVARSEASEKSVWKSAIDAAAAQIEDAFTRTLFKDAMVGAYKSRGEHRLSPQSIIERYLKGKVSTVQAGKATAAAAAAAKRPVPGAAQQRIAESNRTLPRTVAPPGGVAVPARNPRERVADVNRRIRAQLAGR